MTATELTGGEVIGLDRELENAPRHAEHLQVLERWFSALVAPT
jgi:hypothetical protein